MDATEYYLAAYVPPVAQRARAFHRINVRLTRPGTNVRFRQGYREGTSRDLAERDLVRALTVPSVFQSDDLQVEANSLGGRLRVVVLLATSALEFSRIDDQWRCDLTVDAVLRTEGGALADRRTLLTKHVAIKLPTERYEAFLQTENIEIPTEVTLPARGHYQLVVVVRHSGHRVVARAIPLAID
jgi:hypothetical protein